MSNPNLNLQMTSPNVNTQETMTGSSPQQALLDSLLCREWNADSYDGHVLLFKPDGTGEITSRAELNLFLAAHLTWRILEVQSSPGPNPIQDVPNSPPSPTSTTSASCLSRVFQPPPPAMNATEVLIDSATIEITLTPSTDATHPTPMSLISVPKDSGYESMIGGHLLLAPAFEPQVVQIRIESGEFGVPGVDIRKNKNKDRTGPLTLTGNGKFGLQLTFSKSPYPVRCCWKDDMADMLDDFRQFDKRVFVAERLGSNFESGEGEGSSCILM